MTNITTMLEIVVRVLQVTIFYFVHKDFVAASAILLRHGRDRIGLGDDISVNRFEFLILLEDFFEVGLLPAFLLYDLLALHEDKLSELGVKMNAILDTGFH